MIAPVVYTTVGSCGVALLRGLVATQMCWEQLRILKEVPYQERRWGFDSPTPHSYVQTA
ncbi:MAG: hypothetical protein KME13_26315 [Myxacorys californica WJT36-NPBG1]|jgi:hypothetical protein|nr:hypothetical protein [Myxacorys californica WJT36-NPBG1]